VVQIWSKAENNGFNDNLAVRQKRKTIKKMVEY
jgi:hypothetical protein